MSDRFCMENLRDDRLTRYARLIHDRYADVAVATIRRIEQGQNNDIVAVNEDLILLRLHRVPLGDVLPGEGGWVTPARRWEDLYARIQQRLFAYMRPEARAWTIEHFETFLRDRRNRDIVPALVHGDFGTSNILYDGQGQCITGVIDFSSAGPDDPAVDFAAASTLGPNILEHISSTYPQVQGARDRIAFYKGTFALQEALFGVENDDTAAFRAGIEDYR